MLSLINSVSDNTAKAVAIGELDNDSDDESKEKTAKEKTGAPVFVEYHDLQDAHGLDRYFKKLEQKRKIREVWEKQQVVYEDNVRRIFEMRAWIEKNKK